MGAAYTKVRVSSQGAAHEGMKLEESKDRNAGMSRTEEIVRSVASRYDVGYLCNYVNRCVGIYTT